MFGDRIQTLEISHTAGTHIFICRRNMRLSTGEGLGTTRTNAAALRVMSFTETRKIWRIKAIEWLLPSCSESPPRGRNSSRSSLRRPRLGRLLGALISFYRGGHFPPSKGRKRLSLLHGSYFPLTRNKSSSLTSTLPRIRR